MEKKSFEDRIRNLKHEANPECVGVCWQCKYSHCDFETGEDVCLFEEIIEKYNNGEDVEK